MWRGRRREEEEEDGALSPFILPGCGQCPGFLEGFYPYTLTQNVFAFVFAALSLGAQACIDGAHTGIWGISIVTFLRGSHLCPWDHLTYCRNYFPGAVGPLAPWMFKSRCRKA